MIGQQRLEVISAEFAATVRRNVSDAPSVQFIGSNSEALNEVAAQEIPGTQDAPRHQPDEARVPVEEEKVEEEDI